MKLILTSDTHMRHRDLLIPEGDVFIHAGDALLKGNETEWCEFERWFIDLPFAHKFFVPGNHDKKCRQIHKPWVMTNNLVILDGISFWFDAWQVCRDNYPFWISNKSERPTTDPFRTLIQEQWAPDYADVVVSHIGPKCDLNQTHKFPYENIGQSKNFPDCKYHIFGHHHAGRGQKQNYGTEFLNVSCLDETYDELRPCVELTLFQTSKTCPKNVEK